MSVSAISANNPLNQTTSLQNANQQQRAEFQQLTQALQSGNRTNAQEAFSALATSAKNSGLQSLQLTQDLTKLGSALQSGNLSSARQAYSSVQQNLQNSNPMAAHHHRPGHSGSQLLTSGFPDTSSSPSNSVASQSGVFQPINLSA
jgi:HPt (histidine-containing phosphotransfer) domain-containing protein